MQVAVCVTCPCICDSLCLLATLSLNFEAVIADQSILEQDPEHALVLPGFCETVYNVQGTRVSVHNRNIGSSTKTSETWA